MEGHGFEEPELDKEGEPFMLCQIGQRSHLKVSLRRYLETQVKRMGNRLSYRQRVQTPQISIIPK